MSNIARSSASSRPTIIRREPDKAMANAGDPTSWERIILAGLGQKPASATADAAYGRRQGGPIHCTKDRDGIAPVGDPYTIGSRRCPSWNLLTASHIAIICNR
jgi:hypothetical protein